MGSKDQAWVVTKTTKIMKRMNDEERRKKIESMPGEMLEKLKNMSPDDIDKMFKMPMPEDLEDVISGMPKRTALALANKCAALAHKLDQRKACLRKVGAGQFDEDELLLAVLTERLALFEMLIEALTCKLDDLEERLGGRPGAN